MKNKNKNKTTKVSDSEESEDSNAMFIDDAALQDEGPLCINSSSHQSKDKTTIVDVTKLCDGKNNEESYGVSTFCVEELNSDDEVYTFQCPKNFKQHILDNTNFKKLMTMFTKKTGEVCQLEVLNLEKKLITLAVPSKKSNACLINLPLKGHILIHKDLGVSSFDTEENYNVKEDIFFPKNMKCRHPLLGVNWKEQIDIANKVMEHVNLKKQKKNKTKKRKLK